MILLTLLTSVLAVWTGPKYLLHILSFGNSTVVSFRLPGQDLWSYTYHVLLYCTVNGADSALNTAEIQTTVSSGTVHSNNSDNKARQENNTKGR